MVRKLSREVELLELIWKRGGEELWGTKEDKEFWANMAIWDIEAAKFREFCQERLSETDFNLIFGERSSWPECVDWFSVFEKRDALLREFNELLGGD